MTSIQEELTWMKIAFWKHELRPISISISIATIILILAIALSLNFQSFLAILIGLIFFSLITLPIIALEIHKKRSAPGKIGYGKNRISYEIHGTINEIDFSDISRIEYSQYRGAYLCIIIQNGVKIFLGPGCGGDFAHSIIDSYMKWAENNKRILAHNPQIIGFHKYSIISLQSYVPNNDARGNIPMTILSRFVNTPARILAFLFSFILISSIILILGILFIDYLSIFFGITLLLVTIVGLHFFKRLSKN